MTGIDEAAGGSKDKRTRGLFPRISLLKAFELPKKIYEIGDGDAVRRLSVFDKLGRSAESGPSRLLVTTCSAYGITNGSYQAEHLSLTQLGQNLVTAETTTQRNLLAYQILFANDIFLAFVQRFRDKEIKSDEVAVDYLKRDHKLSEDDAKSALSVFKENMADFGLFREYSGRKVVVGRDVAEGDMIASLGPDDGTIELEKTGVSGITPVPVSPVVNPKMSGNPAPPSIAQTSLPAQAPSVNINIEIALPSQAEPAVYDAIFASMAKHLIGRDIASE